MTPGFRLPARYVIHAVGPVWAGGARGEPELLASTYRAAISIAKREGLRSLAFPAISTGIFGYPLRPATALAVSEVRAALAEPGSVERVTFACFSPDVLAAYEAELA